MPNPIWQRTHTLNFNVHDLTQHAISKINGSYIKTQHFHIKIQLELHVCVGIRYSKVIKIHRVTFSKRETNSHSVQMAKQIIFVTHTLKETHTNVKIQKANAVNEIIGIHHAHENEQGLLLVGGGREQFPCFVRPKCGRYKNDASKANDLQGGVSLDAKLFSFIFLILFLAFAAKF